MDEVTTGSERSLHRRARSNLWPELTLAAWEDTRATVHLWTQVVGKVRLALEPAANHWWQVPFYLSARGLTTSIMHSTDSGLEIEFDFIDHMLKLDTTSGKRRTVALEPRTVASFYEATMVALGDLGVHIKLMARPVEVERAIPFAHDTEHAAYDADAIHRFWLALLQSHRVLSEFRGRFTGKASPVHFFWGGFDLATTRFSGRTAPQHPGKVPNCADWVMHQAYSHELSSCGFWPGGSSEGSFYAYAYPEPDGFAETPAGVDAAYYDPALGEFILPYAAVRAADDPSSVLLRFLQSTYEAAAAKGNWDRRALESKAVT
jgi:Family of unknown function (DUF5996)